MGFRGVGKRRQLGLAETVAFQRVGWRVVEGSSEVNLNNIETYIVTIKQ